MKEEKKKKKTLSYTPAGNRAIKKRNRLEKPIQRMGE